MAENKENKEKLEDTSAQGAESTSETTNVEIEIPEWAIELKDVCQKVIESIAQFNENAEKVVKDIISEAKAGNSSKVADTKKPTTVSDIKINKKARYVVAKGKMFHNSFSNSLITEGVDVTTIETERLQSLIAQGIVVEAVEE